MLSSCKKTPLTPDNSSQKPVFHSLSDDDNNFDSPNMLFEKSKAANAKEANNPHQFSKVTLYFLVDANINV